MSETATSTPPASRRASALVFGVGAVAFILAAALSSLLVLGLVATSLLTFMVLAMLLGAKLIVVTVCVAVGVVSFLVVIERERKRNIRNAARRRRVLAERSARRAADAEFEALTAETA